jgi:hypothetical protein
MARYDAESLLSDIETFLKANLNTKISAITTEKNDGITLRTVDSGAYFFQVLDDKIANFNPIVVYGLTDWQSDGIGPANAEKVAIEIAIILTDDSQDANIGKKMLRYHRALTELFNENWAKIRSSLKLKITSLPPITIGLNGQENARAVGIRVEADLV